MCGQDILYGISKGTCGLWKGIVHWNGTVIFNPRSCPSVHPYDLDCLRDNSRIISQILLKLEYSLGKYFQQIRWWVSQLIKYA